MVARRLMLAAAPTLGVIALTACRSSPGSVSPSVAPTSTAPATIAATTPPPSAPPLAPPIRLTKGTAVVHVRGAVKETLRLRVGSNATYQPAPGSFAISFIDRRANALIL